MKWKAESHSEAGAVLKSLASRGERVLKELDAGDSIWMVLSESANDDYIRQSKARKDNPNLRKLA